MSDETGNPYKVSYLIIVSNRVDRDSSLSGVELGYMWVEIIIVLHYHFVLT